MDQAQNKLEAAQSKLKDAQSELTDAQSKSEAAQSKLENAWLAASDKDKDIHQISVQSAKENVQSAERNVQSAKENVQSAKENVQSVKEMRDVYLNAVNAMMQVTMAQSEEGRIVEMLTNLQRNQEQIQCNLEQIQRNPERIQRNEALLFEALLERNALTPVSHYSSATVDGQWHRQSLEYYSTSSCLVLQPFNDSTREPTKEGKRAQLLPAPCSNLLESIVISLNKQDQAA